MQGIETLKEKEIELRLVGKEKGSNFQGLSQSKDSSKK